MSKDNEKKNGGNEDMDTRRRKKLGKNTKKSWISGGIEEKIWGGGGGLRSKKLVIYGKNEEIWVENLKFSSIFTPRLMKINICTWWPRKKKFQKSSAIINFCIILVWVLLKNLNL